MKIAEFNLPACLLSFFQSEISNIKVIGFDLRTDQLLKGQRLLALQP